MTYVSLRAESVFPLVLTVIAPSEYVQALAAAVDCRIKLLNRTNRDAVNWNFILAMVYKTKNTIRTKVRKKDLQVKEKKMMIMMAV